MRTKKLLAAFAVVLFAFSVVAQEKPGTVAALEFQRPKNGMVTQRAQTESSLAQATE